MDIAYQKYHNQDGIMAPRCRHFRHLVRLASSREHTQSDCGLDVKMKAYIVFITTCFFLYGVASGAAFHTVIDLDASQLIQMSLTDLGNVRV